MNNQTEQQATNIKTYPIYLANFPDGELRETSSMFRAKNMPDPTTWTKQEITKINFQSRTNGMVVLKGVWTDAYFRGKYYLLEPLGPVDVDQTIFVYAVVYEIWKNVFPKILSITGVLGKTNNKKILIENIDRVEQQVDINDELHYFDIQADTSDPGTEDVVPTRGTISAPPKIIQHLFSGNEDQKFYLPVNLNPGTWRPGFHVNASTIKFDLVKSWKADLMKEIKEYFHNIELNVGPASKLADINQSALFAEFNKKMFYVLYKKGSVRLSGDTSSFFDVDLKKEYTITDIKPIHLANVEGYKNLIEVSNRYYDSSIVWTEYDSVADEVKGKAHGIVYQNYTESTGVDFFLLIEGRRRYGFYTPKAKVLPSGDQINKNVDKFLIEWRKLCDASKTTNVWRKIDEFNRIGSWEPYVSLTWPKDSKGIYEKFDYLIYNVYSRDGQITVRVLFKDNKGGFEMWFPNIDTLWLGPASSLDIKNFKAKYKHQYVGGRDDKGAPFLGYMDRLSVPYFRDAYDALRGISKLFDVVDKSQLNFDLIFQSKASMPGWVNNTDGELESLIARGVEIFNSDYKHDSLKEVGGNQLLFWPNLHDGQIYTFRLEGTPFILLYRSGAQKIMELLLLDETPLKKFTYKNFSIKGGENVSLSIAQRINQKNTLFCFGENIPVKHKYFSEINMGDISLPGLSIYYLNSDFASPYDNYEVLFENPIEHIIHKVKKLKQQEVSQTYDAESISQFRLQQKFMKEEQKSKLDLSLVKIKGKQNALEQAKNSFLLDAGYQRTNVMLALSQALQGVIGSAVTGKFLGKGKGVMAMGGVGLIHEMLSFSTSQYHQAESFSMTVSDFLIKSELVDQAMKLRTESVYTESRRAEEELVLELQNLFNKFEVPEFDALEDLNHYLHRIGKKNIHWVLSVPNKQLADDYLEPMLHRYGVGVFVNQFVLYPNFEGLYAFTEIDYIELKEGETLELYEKDLFEKYLLNGINMVEYDWNLRKIISDDKFFEKPLPLKQLDFEIAQTREEVSKELRGVVDEIKKKETTWIEVTKEQEAKLKEIRDNYASLQSASLAEVEKLDAEVKRLTLELQAKNAETQRLNELSVQEQGEIATLTTNLQDITEQLTVAKNKVRDLESSQALSDATIAGNTETIKELRAKNWHLWKSLYVVNKHLISVDPKILELNPAKKFQVVLNKITVFKEEKPDGTVNYGNHFCVNRIGQVEIYKKTNKYELDVVVVPDAVLYSSAERVVDVALGATDSEFNDRIKAFYTEIEVELPANFFNKFPAKKKYTMDCRTFPTVVKNSIQSLGIEFSKSWGQQISEYADSARSLDNLKTAFLAGKNWWEW